MAILPFGARADILISNFGPGLAYNTSGGNAVGNAFDNNTYAEGDTFTPTFTATFSSLDIALGCAFVCPDPFNVSLTSDNGGQPGAVIETFSVAGSSLGPSGSNNAPLVLNSALNPVLTAGLPYWITVTSDLSDSISWNWNSTGDTSAEAISTDGGATWFSPSGQTPGALEVDGSPIISSTPEPSSAACLMLALLLLPAIRKSTKA